MKKITIASFGEEGNDYLKRITQVRSRMQNLIEDLLSFSLVTTKGQPFAQINLTKVVQGVISDLQADSLTDVVWEVGELPVISADSGQIYQLFQNILGNSLKYRQPEIRLVVKIYQTPRSQNQALDNGCEIAIEDNGIGFDEAYLEQIFEPCQRLHNSSEYEGTGLGLAICRRIIERHGGKISARSKPGEGAKFIITFPYGMMG